MNAVTDECVVVFHAHPDDEAIFTGGTIAHLTAAGVQVVVVVATDGADPGSALARTREAEARDACALLGVSRVEFLRYADSGLRGDSRSDGVVPFCHAGDAAVEQMAGLLREVGPVALVVYDAGGIYGHPDHVAVHRCGSAAAAAAGVPTIYECTVDREYLHFVETHLVGHAVESLLGIEVERLNAAPLGVPTVEVDLTVDVRPWTEHKRRAMAAHVSQIAADSETLTMSAETFDGVYGFEWYLRRGPAGPLERFAF